MTVSVRLNDDDAMLFRKYADMNGLSMSELVRRSVMERIENDFDMKCYEKAMKEYREHPDETYTLDEVEKELGLA
ncbi:type II toxin-antitoxin system RelB family antitoxin [Mitsuokella sp.]|uniref:type II toxin-antitoxin system RelB family antitoxin n=1 Tax=unclassified Mitsuokella TaxID=2637239 RepID=UPI003D7C6AD3